VEVGYSSKRRRLRPGAKVFREVADSKELLDLVAQGDGLN